MKQDPNHKIDRAKALDERNDKDKAFREDQEKQAERDQLVMPVDDLSNELLEDREENERDKRGTKGPKDI